MARNSDTIEIAAELRHETDAAYLLFDGTREGWVPKTLVERNDDGTFTMPEWMAIDRGFM